MNCAKCQASELPEYAHFCPLCGFPVPIAERNAGSGSGSPGKTVQTALRRVVVALGCLVLLVAIAIFWEAGPWTRYIALVPLPSDLGQQAAVLHEKLEEYERIADTIKTLVSFLISLSTLYALALALNAYLGVQEATKRAEQSVKNLNELQQSAKLKYDRDLMDIRKEFPLFGEMQSRIGDIRNVLRMLIPEGGFGEAAFRIIGDAEKVRIAHYEQTVASFEFFNLEPFREDAGKIYQLLGSFHSHKWLLEKQAGVKNDAADVHWARFYLARSHDLIRDDVATLNEMGYFGLKVTKESERAHEQLRRSLDLDSKQQRPRYLLSIIAHSSADTERRRGDVEAAARHYAESVRLLNAAFQMDRWQQEDEEERSRRADFMKRTTSYMYYNRACARARLAELESDPTRQAKLREDAVNDLKSALPSGTVPRGAEQLAHDFELDTNAEGDLFALALSPWGNEVRKLLERLKS